MKPSKFLQALLFVALSLGCRSTPETSEVAFQWIETDGKGTGTILVNWPCALRDDPEGRGKLQDEYCEWDRLQAAADGTLSCVFRSSFAKDRSHWLPERYDPAFAKLDPKLKPRPEFEHTKSNTYRALIKLVEDCASSLDNHIDPRRVDPENHRIATSGKVVGDVDRSSDKKICSLVQDLTFKRKRSVRLLPLPTLSGESEQPGVSFDQRQVLPKECRVAMDPKLQSSHFAGKSAAEMESFAQAERTYIVCETREASPGQSCDDFAPSIYVGLKVEVK